MAKQRKSIYLATLVLLVLVFVACFFQTRQSSDLPVSVILNTREDTQEIQLWRNDDNICYIFLPSHAELTQVQVALHTEEPVSINGVRIADGMSCGGYFLNIPYDFSYKEWGREIQCKLIFMKSANVPAMFIDTQSGSMDYIHERKKNNESGTITLYSANGGEIYTGDLKSIQGRGNNTWNSFDKKPYSIRLSEAADLLEMGCAQEWVLLANADDPSHVRNKIAYESARKIGLAYSPDSDWVDLYLNGEYAGLYLLAERNEIHPERVDISAQTGVLLSLEKEARMISQNYPYVKTNSGQTLRVHHPALTSDAELRSIAEYIQPVENAILTGEDEAAGKGLLDLIDADSWVKNYMVDEFFGNLDGFWVSRYFYYDQMGGKLMAGPVWDYDKSMGNDNTPSWSIPDGNVLVVNRHAQRKNDTPLWANRIYMHPVFKELLVKCFVNDMLPLMDQWLKPQINKYADHIGEAAELNGIRWNSYSQECTFDSEIAEVIRYLQDHAEYLYDLWIDQKEICQVCVAGGGHYLFYTLQRGEKLPELPVVDNMQDAQFVGWYDMASDEPFDITKPITEDMEIYAKWQDKPARLLGQVGKLLPLGILMLFLGLVFLTEVRRWNLQFLKK